MIDHEAVRIEARDLRLEPELTSLLSRTISITRAEAGAIEVTLHRREPQPPSEPHFMPHLLRLVVGAVDLRRVVLVLANGQRYAVASITGSLTSIAGCCSAPIVTVKDPAGEAVGEVRLRAARPMGVNGTLAGRWRLPDGHDYRFSSAVGGNLDRLGTSLRLVQPARLSFTGNALDLTGTPRVLGTLRAIDFDGSPWVPAGRFPRLSGSVAIDAGRSSIGLDGTITSKDFIDEPLRLQGGGTWQGRVIEITALRAWLPRSAASFTTSGTIDLAPESPVLALRGEWSDAPLAAHRRADGCQCARRIPRRRQPAVRLRGEGRDHGPADTIGRMGGTGLVGRESLTIDAVDAYTLRGRIHGAGRLAWTGDQAWRFTARARSLDLRGLRADLNGRIDLDGSIDGRGFGANAPFDARIASLSGVLWGRALNGKGEIARRDGGYELRGVRVTNGESYAQIDGRYGQTIDLSPGRRSSLARRRRPAALGPADRDAAARRARPPGRRSLPRAKLAAFRYGDVLDRLRRGGCRSRPRRHAGFTRRRPGAARSTAARCGSIASSSARAAAPASTSCRSRPRRPATNGTVSPGSRRGSRHAGHSRSTGAAGTASSLPTQFTFPDGSATLLQPAALDLSPEAAKRRADLPRDRRGAVLRGGTVDGASRELAADLQCAGLAA